MTRSVRVPRSSMRIVRIAPAWLAAMGFALHAAAADAPPPEPPGDARVLKFDVFEYRVEGNTVLSAEAIERAVYPMLGEGRTADDVEAARAALEKAYRDAGYGTVSVDTPEQSVASGVINLQVVQGTVSRLRVLAPTTSRPTGSCARCPNSPKARCRTFRRCRSNWRRSTPARTAG